MFEAMQRDLVGLLRLQSCLVFILREIQVIRIHLDHPRPLGWRGQSLKCFYVSPFLQLLVRWQDPFALRCISLARCGSSSIMGFNWLGLAARAEIALWGGEPGFRVLAKTEILWCLHGREAASFHSGWVRSSIIWVIVGEISCLYLNAMDNAIVLLLFKSTFSCSCSYRVSCSW